MGDDPFCPEEFFAKCRCFFGIKRRTGKDIKVDTFFIFRKVCGYGTGFNKLNKRVAAGYRIFVAEMRNERLAESLHVNHVVAELLHKARNFTLR